VEVFVSSTVVESPVADTVDKLIAQEEKVFLRRQPRSSELIAEARVHLAGGATSNWQIAEPQAVWMSHGAGSKVYDVDGNEYVDMHGGYGAAIAGHAHPAIVAAVSDRVRRGTHFAQPTEDAIWIAGELARRFELPLWRFANSGTESTMDAVHLARALTGRDLIIKVEGCYHGHHDSVQVSVLPEADEVGPRDAPTRVPGNSGIPAAIRDLVIVVPFNDTGAVARALAEHRGQVAAMILEPVMMNAGIIPPDDGYLAVIRDLLHGEGAFLIYDEVKTGFTTGPGGITARTGVVPDMVCLAKALGGGISVAAIGGTETVMSAIADGRYEQVGTFNGNPLAMAATRATLTDVLTPQAYSHLDELATRLRSHHRQARVRLARRLRRCQGLRDLPPRSGARVQGLLADRRPTRPFALADAAQWRCISPAMGEGGAMAVVGSARPRRCRPVRGQLRAIRGSDRILNGQFP
jgi:glutamate-1-semialdehyde 2,1-aminomutase